MKDMIVDGLIKLLLCDIFKEFRKKLGMISLEEYILK